jgi:putative SOS response-associated peptidase YedK
MINARSETVAEKPSFRAAFKTRRCLVLTDGYYEWQQRGSRKQPYFFHRSDDQPFAFAGLWERWLDPQSGSNKETATILTTAANEQIEPFHHRMPVILEPENYDRWLDPELSDRSVLEPLLTAQPSEDLIIDPVSTLVNSPRNDDSRCLEPPRELF